MRARASSISEVEVVFSRLPKRPVLVRPPTPTCEIPPTLLDAALRETMPTDVDCLLDELEDEEEEDVATVPLRDAFDLRETSPAWTAPMTAPMPETPPRPISHTVPIVRDVLREAEALAATIRAQHAAAPPITYRNLADLRQPPPTWPPPPPGSYGHVIVPAPLPAPRQSRGLTAALLVATAALLGGAATLLYALSV